MNNDDDTWAPQRTLLATRTNLSAASIIRTVDHYRNVEGAWLRQDGTKTDMAPGDLEATLRALCWLPGRLRAPVIMEEWNDGRDRMIIRLLFIEA